MTIIKINHKDWIDEILIEEENKLMERLSQNKDKGTYIINDNFLLIKWEKWGIEYFYKINNEYYHITDQFIFDLYNFISNICIINENNNINLYLLDLKNNRLYSKNNLKLYAHIEKHTCNKLFLNNSIICIYFDYKYYESNYFNTLYTIININKFDYLLLNNSDLFYKDYNKYDIGKFIKYKNKIILNNEDIIYISSDYYHYNPFSLKKSIIYNVNDEIIISDLIFFINYNKNIFDFIPIIEYYKYFSINCFILDNINNLYNNKILDDLDILYYNNLEDLTNFLKKNINKTFFIQSDNKDLFLFLELNKNIILYNNLFDIVNYNDNLIKPIYIQNIWNQLNKNNIDKFAFLLNNYNNINEIPKIIHFIWIGNNLIPKEYEYYIQTWIKNYDDYIFCFWNDSNIPKLINQKYYDTAKSYAMKADILRYELLYFFGGIYVDCDCISIKKFDNLIKDYWGFSGYESDQYIAIGLMGFKKKDSVLFQLITKLSYNINNLNSNYVPKLTGPIFFTKIWEKYSSNKHIAFPIDYFYSYTFQDKIDHKPYKLSSNNYSIHMWGYSWAEDNLINNINQNKYYYVLSYYFNNTIISDINKIKYSDLSTCLKNQIFFHKKINNPVKQKIVHIMGMFFTGGIERYLYYIDKYGSHDKYQYYILYIHNENKYETKFYDIQNIKMISYEWNHQYLNDLLINIRPDLIIDHYSLYLNCNNDIYININRNNIIYYVHSAICYNKDITELNINKCIHLYKETNKHISWNKIPNNYYLTLGTELNYYSIPVFKKQKICISIIGRIAEEKIPILFLKKLSNLSHSLYKNIEINIYGEKDNIFNKEYIDKFDKIIRKSKINIHNFVHPNYLKEIFINTDILLIPSVYETGSFTCIEAFSYGIPVIARNVYGLKYLIEDKKTGYLCNNDNEILDKIKNLSTDTIFNNKDYILERSLSYNIIDKIKDLENIINENVNSKNLVIITSIINISNYPLSYYPTRSIFTLKERFKQTMKTISSLKKNIPNLEILFCECSELKEEVESEIKDKVNYYYNFYTNEEIRDKVNSCYKGLGEATLLLNAIKYIDYLNYKNIFKISGRYYLNTHFDYHLFDNNYNIFTNWDDNNKSLCTIFYKLDYLSLTIFKEQLEKAFPKLEEGLSIEQVIYQFFSNYSIIYNKLNISGFLSTEGYLFTV